MATLNHTKIHGSSNVAAVSYDPADKSMEIAFHDGGKYRYHNVPPMVHEGLLKSPSAGGYVAKYVRGKFRTEKA